MNRRGGERDGEVKIGVLCSRVRVEEKLLFAALEERGVDYDRVDAQALALSLIHI